MRGKGWEEKERIGKGRKEGRRVNSPFGMFKLEKEGEVEGINFSSSYLI